MEVDGMAPWMIMKSWRKKQVEFIHFHGFGRVPPRFCAAHWSLLGASRVESCPCRPAAAPADGPQRAALGTNDGVDSC